MFAQIDEALASRGISTVQSADAELWEVGAMVGANRADEDSGDEWDEMAGLAEGFDRSLLR